jgi:hypothetical protein
MRLPWVARPPKLNRALRSRYMFVESEVRSPALDRDSPELHTQQCHRRSLKISSRRAILPRMGTNSVRTELYIQISDRLASGH